MSTDSTAPAADDELPSPAAVLRRHLFKLLLVGIVGAVAAASVALGWPSKVMVSTALLVGHVPADPFDRPGDKSVPLAEPEEVVAWLTSGSLPRELAPEGKGASIEASANGLLVKVVVRAAEEDTALAVAEAALARIEADHQARLDTWRKEVATTASHLEKLAAPAADLAVAGSRATSPARISAAMELARGSIYTRPTRRVAAPWADEVRPSVAKAGVAGAVASLGLGWALLFLLTVWRQARRD